MKASLLDEIKKVIKAN